jgi:serine phosphatase RsbU (regulator of sigma subunit)/pSer/pThr/pTyr-binding forkhead associated (FHA) protein
VPPANPSLVLEPVLGPPLEAIPLHAGTPLTLGRLPDCEVRLPESEKTVSRRHCRVESDDLGTWFVTDLGSRHGTFVNDMALAANAKRPLRVGDALRVGPWVFKVQQPGSAALNTLTMDDTRGTDAKLIALARPRQETIDRRRLELLIACSKRIQSANDELSLAEAVLDALVEGTGYPRAAIIRPGQSGGFERIDLLGTRMSRHSTAAFQFSRSLLQAACSGQMVQLRRDDGPVPPMSIMSSGTVTAMAVPILLDHRAALCIYLDARADEPPAHDDAAAFCQAIAEMCALSVASLQRRRLESERLRLTEQMDAAMQIQRQILPPTRGELGPVRYAMDLRPGRFVAGDLFDILRLDDRRVAFFLGDVSGKGLPAAILMATTQSFLNASLQHFDDPAQALDAVNRHLVDHAPESKFVSLWVGVLDTHTGVLRYCDAGHGYWLLREPGAPPRCPEPGASGVPLRVDENSRYASRELQLKPGSRLVLFSDGAIEQAGVAADGQTQMFGLERIVMALAPAQGCEHDVSLLVQAVQDFARVDVLGDDLTVGSIEFVAPGPTPARA